MARAGRDASVWAVAPGCPKERRTRHVIVALAAIINVSSSLGYLLPAIIGLESMGIPSPGETALVLAAVLASQGSLEIWLVILIGVASAILGYLLGRRFGRRALVASGPLHEHRLRAVKY